MPKRAGDFTSKPKPPGYYLVAAMLNNVNGTRNGWTFLLQTEDLFNLSLVPGAGDPAHGNAIFWTAHPLIAVGPTGCDYTGIAHFDEQYAAPGSVLQDPQGNMIMVYESEIHCPYSSGGGAVGWISVGVAHSLNRDKPTGVNDIIWPGPVAAPGYENNWLDYGNGRYAVLTIPGVPQTKGEFEGFYGNSLPSAFIDDVNPSGEKYLYVLYNFTGSPTTKPDGKIHIARAKLNARNNGRTPEKLQFKKWYNGGWNAPGIQTNMANIEDDGINPAGCEGVPSADSNAQLTYNEALGLYMLTYVCHRYDCSTKRCKRINVSWYYRTTHDLSTQNWSAPRLIENSTRATINKTDGNGKVYSYEDGDYPTFMTPGCAPGHIGLTGYAFLLNGDSLGDRVYARRKFVINPNDTLVWKACGQPINAQESPSAGKENASISPDKQWEYKCAEYGAGQCAPEIVRTGTTQVALDLDQELEVHGPESSEARVVWAPDSKRFGFNYSPPHAHHTTYKTVAFYQLRAEKWVALRSPEDDLVELAKELVPKKVHKSRDELIPDIVKVHNWTDARTAILFSAWRPTSASLNERLVIAVSRFQWGQGFTGRPIAEGQERIIRQPPWNRRARPPQVSHELAVGP